jgi:polyisoprenoid-binding protein YceI
MLKIYKIAPLLILSFSAAKWAETNVRLSLQPSNTIILKGTSTLHDYECKSTAFNAVIEMDTLMRSFTFIDVTIPVKSIHSESSSMDENMYEALKAEEYANIKFSLLHSDNAVEVNSIRPDSTLQLRGTLIIAGKEQLIDLSAKVIKDSNGIITVRGEKKILMTDYGIKPPTFMLGVLKTGNEVAVEFEVGLKSSELHVLSIPSN